MKKKILLFLVLAAVVIIGVSALSLNPGGAGDEFGGNIGYTEDYKYALSVNAHFDVTHGISKKYRVKTDDTGVFPLAYNADIEDGDVTIYIKAGKKTIRKITVDKTDYVVEKLSPNQVYTIELNVKKGRGNINIGWMEMSQDVKKIEE